MKISINSLRPAVSQSAYNHTENSGICLDGKSVAACCNNLRNYSDEVLQPVSEPTLCGLLTGRFAGIDRCEEYSVVFTQLDDGTVCIEGRISSSDNSFVPEYSELGKAPERVMQIAASGILLVLRLQSGKLIYLKRIGNEYAWLGELPQAPQATAVAVASPITIESVIDRIVWKEPVADLRPGVPDAVSTETGKRLLSAYKTATDRLHEAGLWFNPVLVRFGYKLWDGRPACLSAPQPVGMERGFAYCPAVDLPLTPEFDDKGKQTGYCGTESAAIRLHGFNIEVKCAEIPQEWEGVIDSVEMYVSNEPENTDFSTAPETFFRQIYGADSLLHVVAARVENSVSQAVYNRGDWWLHSSASDEVYGAYYTRNAGMTLLDRKRLSAMGGLWGVSARCMLCHDEMLHLGGIERLMPYPLPGGFKFNPEGNASLEPMSGGRTTGVGRFDIEPGLIAMETDCIVIHSPLVLWCGIAGSVRFRLRVLHSGSVYETYLHGKPVIGENACCFLADGGVGIRLQRTAERSLEKAVQSRESMPATVMTMTRGNCLVETWHTDRIGGNPTGMAAQTIGGGAYTRQYIYLFTHLGITALTHNYKGEHTNCRTISPERVAGEECYASTSHGVFLQTSSGKLLQLTDARCREVLTQLNTDYRIGWDGVRDELWLLSAGRVLVLQCGFGMRAYTRDTTLQEIIQSGTRLYGTEDCKFKDVSAKGKAIENCQWQSAVFEFKPDGRTTIDVGISGENVDAEISVERVSADESVSVELERVGVTGRVYQTLQIPLFATARKSSGCRTILMRIRISGKFDKLK